MKIAVITDEISQDLEEAAKIAASFGLDALELRSVWDKPLHELSSNEVNKIIDICKSYKLDICALSAPFFKCDRTKEQIEQHLEILKKTIVLAKKLNCKIIRAFSFWKANDFETELPLIAKAFEKPAKMALDAGVVLAIELDPSVNTCNGEMVAQLVKKINHLSVQALWDPGNDVYSPIFEKPFPTGYEFVKPFIAHVHLKDAIKNKEDVQSVKLGTGEVNWSAQLKALVADNYNGYISIETHYRKGSDISEDLMKKPGGSAFSLNGREASEECIQALKGMLKKIS